MQSGQPFFYLEQRILCLPQSMQHPEGRVGAPIKYIYVYDVPSDQI